MNIFKKIVKKVFDTSLEVAKDSASEIGKIASPGKISEQMTGSSGEAKKGGNDITDYLKKLDPKLTPEQMSQMNQKEVDELAKARSVISAAIPAHMRPLQQQRELRPYDVAKREEEQKKEQAKQMETQKGKQLPQMSQKQARGSMKGKKKASTQAFGGEIGKNVKSG